MKNQNSNIDKDVFLAQWLDGQLSDIELKNLVSEADFKVYKKLKKGIEVSEKLEAPIDQSFVEIQKRITQKQQEKQLKVRPLYRNWIVGVAASIVLLFGLFSLFGNDNVIIETGFGENKTIALLDGSEVILNSKSKITYDKDDWENNRVLTLDGEAYFKVEKGNTFTVKTANGFVTVLGTQFNVNSTNDFFDVVCYEGKVSVNTTTSEHVLLTTNSLRKINGDPAELSKTQLIKPTWVSGESTFKSVPIKYVISALEDQYNLSFNSESIDDSIIFTGSFPHNNIDVALKTVFETMNIKYSEKEERNIKLGY
ncbi:FecR family protein [uncultured Winogradskyella sp.]|uniref:FecR family protein n=1 Tax=uncultured Winogradskyella sp. TaxID=395353 RepID=UPI0030ED70EF|tara:strand:- start:574 stop:1506 length:933 start_codon:yes stop_codon:yes gene_type:complete